MLCGRRRKKQNIEEGSILMENPKWIRCPACRNKTRERIREDTTFKKIEEIREEAEYPSYRVSFEARLDTIPAKQPNVESGYYYRGFDYCNKVFARKGWWSSTGVDRNVEETLILGGFMGFIKYYESVLLK